MWRSVEGEKDNEERTLPGREEKECHGSDVLLKIMSRLLRGR